MNRYAKFIVINKPTREVYQAKILDVKEFDENTMEFMEDAFTSAVEDQVFVYYKTKDNEFVAFPAFELAGAQIYIEVELEIEEGLEHEHKRQPFQMIEATDLGILLENRKDFLFDLFQWIVKMDEYSMLNEEQKGEYIVLAHEYIQNHIRKILKQEKEKK